MTCQFLSLRYVQLIVAKSVMSKVTPALTAILISSCLGFLVVQLDVSVVNVGLQALRDAFNTNLTGLQWVINSYALVFSALLILGGAWGDKYGAKAVFCWGFAVFTLGSIGCGLANSMTVLIALQGIQGAGAALLVPTSLTLIRLTFKDANTRRTAVAMWGACGGIALAAGPVLGGILIQYFGWRSVFLINVPIGLIAIILILRFAPASPRVEKKVDAAGQIMSAMAIASLTYAVTESSERGWTALPVSALCLAAIFTLSFIVTERHVADPMLPPRLVKNKMLIAMCLSGAVINLVFYGTVFVLSLFFQTVKGYDALQTGIAFIPLTAVLTVSTMISSRVARRVSAVRIITTGFSVQIVGFLLLSQLSVHSSLWLLNGALMLVGTGSAMSVPSVTNTLLGSVSQHDAGISSGLMSSARQLGGVIGVAIFGALITHADANTFSQGMTEAMWLSALVLFICILMNLFMTRRARGVIEV